MQMYNSALTWQISLGSSFLKSTQSAQYSAFTHSSVNLRFKFTKRSELFILNCECHTAKSSHLSSTSINRAAALPIYLPFCVLTNSPALQRASITRPALLVFSLFLLLLGSGVASVPKVSLPCGATVLILGSIPGKHTPTSLHKKTDKRLVVVPLVIIIIYLFVHICACVLPGQLHNVLK